MVNVPDSFVHFVSSGFLGCLVFLLTWIVYGNFLAWRHRSSSLSHPVGTFIRRFYLSSLLASLASLLLHMQLDRSSFGGLWVYLFQEINGHPHPYGLLFVAIIIVILVLSVFIVSKLEKKITCRN